MRKTISIFVVLSCAAASGVAAAREEYKRDFHQSVALPAGRAFRIDSQFGRISIHAQPQSAVAIQAVIRCSAKTLDAARRCADQIHIAIEDKAGAVTVRTEYPPNTGSADISFNVDYDITMPDAAPLDLRNRYGSTEVSNLHASAVINSANGSVRLLNGRGRQHIENTFGMVEARKNEGDLTINNSGGPTLVSDITGAMEITNRYGEVRVTNAGRGVAIHSNDSNIAVSNAGGPATITNTFGNVTVSDVRSDVTVQNQNGEITARRIAGKADLRNSYSAIKFSGIGKALEVHATNAMVRGDTVAESATIETSFGSVDLQNVKGSARISTGNSPIRVSEIGGDLYAKTSFAAITIANVAGPITVEAQNASVAVDIRGTRPCRPVSIATSFGPIRLTLPPAVGYNVTARTTFNNIHLDPSFKVSANAGKNSAGFNGRIGAGGCELRLMNQNGSIDILP